MTGGHRNEVTWTAPDWFERADASVGIRSIPRGRAGAMMRQVGVSIAG